MGSKAGDELLTGARLNKIVLGQQEAKGFGGQ